MRRIPRRGECIVNANGRKTTERTPQRTMRKWSRREKGRMYTTPGAMAQLNNWALAINEVRER